MSRTARVALITPSLRGGGLEKLVRDLALGAAERALHAAVFCVAGLGVFAGDLKAAGITVVDCEEGRFRLRGIPRRLIRSLKAFGPTVLHAHSGTWYPSAVARTLLRYPRLIYTDHGRYLPEPWRRSLVERWCATRTDRIIAVSHPLAEYMHDFLHLKRVPDVIQNGVDLDRYRDATGEVRARNRHELGYRDDDIVMVILGRLMAVKNHAGLVRAMAQAIPDVPQLRLAVIGSGPLESELRQLVQRLGLDGRVQFLGFRRDVPACLQAADIFAMPSTTEGLPIALLEAMAAHLPIIASGVGGIPGALGEPPAGVLVPAGDTGALKTAVIQLARDAERRRQLGALAGQRSSQFSLDRFVERYCSLYSMLTRGAAP